MSPGRGSWRVAVVLLLSISGCKDTRPTQDRFCIDYVDAVVDFQVRCGSETTGFGEDWKYRTSPLRCAVAPKVTFDRDLAQACLAAIKTRDCGAQGRFCPATISVGTVALGGSCFDGECAPGLYCAASTSCPGQCAARIAVGEPALGPCVDDARPLEGVCASPRALGESCAVVTTARPECAAGTVCGGDDHCIERTSVDAGQYCNAAEGLFCEQGSQCLGDGCVPFSKAGEPCGAQRSCQWNLVCNQSTCHGPAELGEGCSVNSDCRAHLFCGEGSCFRRPELGAYCAPGGFQCAAGLVCPDAPAGGEVQRCHQPFRRGEACTDLGEDPCGEGLFCGIDGCADQLPGGSKCRGSRQCQSQQCGADGFCTPACLPPLSH